MAKGWRNPRKNLYLGSTTFNLFQNSCFDVIGNEPTKPGEARSSHFEKAISFLTIPVWFQSLVGLTQVRSQAALTRLVKQQSKIPFLFNFSFDRMKGCRAEAKPKATHGQKVMADVRLNRASDFFSCSGQEWSNAIFGHADMRPDLRIRLAVEVKHSNGLGFTLR